MGTMGLALPWKARIASAPREAAAASAVTRAGDPATAGKWGTRVEGSEHLGSGPQGRLQKRLPKTLRWRPRAGQETFAPTSACTHCTAPR